MSTPANAGSAFALRPTWPGRAKAFGLVLLYILVLAALVAVGVFTLARTHLLHAVNGQSIAPTEKTLLMEAGMAAVAVISTGLMAFLTREGLSRYGFAVKGAAPHFLTGLAAGLVLMAGVLGAMSAAGAYDFGPVALAPDRVLGSAAFYALLFLLVALLEETAFRSFILVQLSRAISFWPAAVLLAVLFGLAHASSANENPLGLLQAGLAGLVLAYSFQRTGALWFAIGFHAAWDYAETFIFGVPDSGHPAQGALMRPDIHGPVWLTGGKVGPEGSVLVFVALLLLALFIRFALPRREA